MTDREVARIVAALAQAGVGAAGITSDSRRVQAGEVFAAWPGYAVDGRRFIASAVANGAAAVLWDDAGGFDPGPLPVPAIPVANLRELAGPIADRLYGRPSAELWMAGVTGTNGKTTVSQWIARALSELDAPCGVIGTLGNGFPGQLADTRNTTPDALELHRVLAGFRAAGGRGAAMEVSSIGLDQGRVNGVRFDAAIFTNLSRDHLDYHGSMEAYAAAKARLFALPGVETSIINLDDAYGAELARNLAGRGAALIGYSQRTDDRELAKGIRLLRAEAVRAAPAGLRFDLNWDGCRREVEVSVVAPFNVSNLLAVTGALLARGIALVDALHAVSRLTPPEGRMQLLGGEGGPLVVVDYAHTPDALAKVLEAVRATADARSGRVVCVFGCGGDRDPGKRPLMGEVARELADRVIVTSDNPRSEDPVAIVDAVLAGAGAAAERIVDRADAIATAIAQADAGDVVVLAGKGHEPYQEVKGVRLPFSDVAQAHRALEEWNRERGAIAC